MAATNGGIVTTIALNDNMSAGMQSIYSATARSVDGFYRLERAIDSIHAPQMEWNVSAASEIAEQTALVSANTSNAGNEAMSYNQFLQMSVAYMYKMVSLLSTIVSRTDGMADAMNNVKQSTEEVSSEMAKVNDNTNSGKSGLSEMITKTAKLAGAFIGLKTAAAGIGSVLNISDEMTQTSARLSLIVDDGGSVDELQQKIYASAQTARASYTDTANVIAKLEQNAGDAFASNDETIAFAENLNKMFTIAGASQEEMASASLQLTQALGSGVLRGDELNSVFEAAPNVIQTIADYMDVPIGRIREMEAEGHVTPDIVKNAMLSATDDINAQFNSMPMTFAQVWQSIKNNALIAFQPVLDKISEIMSSERFNTFVNGAIGAISTLASVAADAFDVLLNVGNTMIDIWGQISPVIIPVIGLVGAYTAALAYNTTITAINSGVEAFAALCANTHAAAKKLEAGATFQATAAQYGFNAALFACPLTWIVIAIFLVIAAIYAVVSAINKVTGSTISATGVIMGALATVGAYLYNLVLSYFEFVLSIISELVNGFMEFASFLVNVFQNPVSSIIYLFRDMGDSVLGIIESIASAIDTVFGSDLAGSVQSWRSGLSELADKAVEKYAADENYVQLKNDFDLSLEDLGLERINYGNAWSAGYDFGEYLADQASGVFTVDNTAFNADDLLGGIDVPTFDDMAGSFDEMAGGIDDIAGNTDDINANTEEIKNNEDIQDLIRDYHSMQATKGNTTQYITVDLSGQTNNIGNAMELAEVNNSITTGLLHALENAPQGA